MKFAGNCAYQALWRLWQVNPVLTCAVDEVKLSVPAVG